MIITTASIQALQTTVSQVYSAAWGETTPFYPQIATEISSTTRIGSYAWMKRIQKMRQWLGPRQIQNLSNHEYFLENLDYENTVGVNRNDMEDDILGIYTPVFQELARTARKLPDQLAKTALQAGVTNLGFDGQAFFSTTHNLNPAGNQSNNIIAAGGPDSAGWDAVSAAMASFTGEDGEPLGVVPNLVIVPPQLALKAKTTLTTAFGASGASNVQQGEATVLVVPELANEPTIWYAADTSHAIKGLVFQNRKPPELASLVDPTDPNVFNLNEYLWGLHARGAVGYGPWFLLTRVRPS